MKKLLTACAIAAAIPGMAFAQGDMHNVEFFDLVAQPYGTPRETREAIVNAHYQDSRTRVATLRPAEVGSPARSASLLAGLMISGTCRVES